MLLGRLLLEKLGVKVDYEFKTMKFPNGEWQPVPLSLKGEYMVTLVDDPAVLIENLNHVDFDNPVSIDEVFGIFEGGNAKNDPRAGTIDRNGPQAGQDGESPLDGDTGAECTGPADPVGHIDSNLFPSDQGRQNLASDKM